MINKITATANKLFAVTRTFHDCLRPASPLASAASGGSWC